MCSEERIYCSIIKKRMGLKWYWQWFCSCSLKTVAQCHRILQREGLSHRSVRILQAYKHSEMVGWVITTIFLSTEAKANNSKQVINANTTWGSDLLDAA